MATSAAMDWVGEWFNILEEQGDVAEIPFGRIAPGATEPEWIRLKHAQVDGVGGLSLLLRKEGWTIPQLPRMAQTQKPGFLGALRALSRVQKESRTHRSPWVTYDPHAKGKRVATSWHRFGEQETEALRAAAKAMGVTLNSFLLWHLNQAISPLLREYFVPRPWMIPINLRGGVKREDETLNHSSYLRVDIGPKDSAAQVQEAVVDAVRSGTHWGNWWSIGLGRWMGRKVMFKTFAGYRKAAHSWTGTFSNLGVWPPEGAHPPAGDTAAWMVAVTVTLGHPIGAGCLTWNGRLGITLQLHPTLGQSDEGRERIFEAWKRSLFAA